MWDLNGRKCFLDTLLWRKWIKVCQHSFENLKEVYTIALILVLSIGNGGIMVYIEASRQESSCVLM